MKLKSLIITIFAAFFVVGSFAQDRDKPNRPKGPQVAPAPDRPSREAMIKKFDKDGEGKLNEEERAALRKAMGQRPRPGGKPGARPGGKGRPDGKPDARPGGEGRPGGKPGGRPPRKGGRPGGKPAPKDG